MRRSNIGIIAHVDAGKTTLTEQLLFCSGTTLRPGRVDDGTARTDYMAVEQQRGISVKAATTYLAWQNLEINLIDTPGHTDFAAEVERSLQVLDCAVLCLSAVEGVQAQSEQYCAALRKLDIPIVLFINKTDRVGADSGRVLADVENILGLQPLDYSRPDSWLLQLAEHDEALAEIWLEGKKISNSSLEQALAEQTAQQLVVPFACGSALRGEGITALLNLLAVAAPPASGDPDGPVAGFVFKVEHDQRLGRIAYIRLYSGSLKNRDTVFNATRQSQRKVVQIRKASGNKTTDIGLLSAGDIAAVCGLGDVVAGDVLGDAALIPQGMTVVQPLLRVRLRPVSGADYTRLVTACSELSAEDPKLNMIWISGVRQLLISVTGVIQTEILVSLLAERFDLAVIAEPPRIIYKETPLRPAIGYDAYTMPKPCWAIVKFAIEPLPAGSGVIYESKTPDNRIHYRYQGQIEQTILTALQQGPQGWAVTDVKVTLVDGEDHPVHTHPLDFATVTPIALMKGLAQAGTRLLEPIQRFHLSIPEPRTGRMISEIIRMRGTIDSDSSSETGRRILNGRVPAATSMDFPVYVAQETGGRGILAISFDSYQPCPDGQGEQTEYRGVNPLDRDRYILQIRGALQAN